MDRAPANDRQQPNNQALTPQELRTRLLDPRGDPNSRQFDRNFAEETDRLYQAAYSGPADRAPPANDDHTAGEFTGRVPSEVDGYRLSSEKLAPFMAEFQRHDLFNDARSIAKKAGLTDTQFNGFVGPLLESLHASGNDASVDLSSEVLKLAPPEASHLSEQGQRAAAGKRIEAALNYLDDATAQGLDRKVADFLAEQLGDHALGIQAIEWFRSQRAQSPQR